MNANEVIATLASRLLGEWLTPTIMWIAAKQQHIIPTTIHASAALLPSKCCRPCCIWVQVISKKFEAVTVHQDRLHAFDGRHAGAQRARCSTAGQLKGQYRPLAGTAAGVLLAQGGTAVGTGIKRRTRVCRALLPATEFLTGVLTPGKNCSRRLAPRTPPLQSLGQLKATAVSMKIANDLR